MSADFRPWPAATGCCCNRQTAALARWPAHDARLQENHLRSKDGDLLEVVATWTAEAERFEGDCEIASAAAPTIEEAWAKVRDEIAAMRFEPNSPVRLRRA
ncbi:MAG: hypothetical protein WKF45_08570 [Ilumatobacteraceae bacterium]